MNEIRDRLREVAGDEAAVTKLLAGALAVALLAVVAFSIAPIGSGETYTEFYVLGPNGTASNYPENVTVGESAGVRIGVGNFQNHQSTYTLVVRTNETTFVTRTITLGPQEEWEDLITVTFDSPGSKRLRLELYRGETAEGQPYRSLRLIVRVTRNTPNASSSGWLASR